MLPNPPDDTVATGSAKFGAIQGIEELSAELLTEARAESNAAEQGQHPRWSCRNRSPLLCRNCRMLADRLSIATELGNIAHLHQLSFPWSLF
jgi:hypothetical protein